MNIQTYLLSALFVLASSTRADARLAPSRLSDLIKSAELIVEAAPVVITRTGFLAGSAKLRILRVVAGKHDHKTITITWGDEVHDQSIHDLNHDWLLFLKRDKAGALGPARYGRSYWPFIGRIVDTHRANLDSPRRAFEYRYPLTMCRLTKAQKKSLLFGTKPMRLRYSKLRQLILRRKGASTLPTKASKPN